MTKYGERNQWSKPADTPISLPNYEYENRVFYCDSCHRNLQRPQDRNGENVSYYCNNCSIEVFPTEIRSKSRLTTPDGPIEQPAVTLLPEKTINRKTKEPRGSFLKLQEKGLKISNYSEKTWRKESND